MHDLSLGEFEALIAKAMRGAGYPWGLCTDGAYAARSLVVLDQPAGAAVARLLTQLNAGRVASAIALDRIDGTTTAICPIAMGTALLDLGESALEYAPRLLQRRPMFEPLLLAPFLGSGSIVWESGQIDVRSDGMHSTRPLPQGPIIISIHPIDEGPTSVDLVSPSGTRTRAAVDNASYDNLLSFARRTYAPATEASRQGAGARTTDND